MEDDITIIAGANNSGKTSLVELFNSVFSSQKNTITEDDFSISSSTTWADTIFPIVYKAFLSLTKKEEIIETFINSIYDEDAPDNSINIKPITVKIQIDYLKNKDDIRNFADYIMDFDPNQNSFYFIYKYDLNLLDFKKSLDLEFNKLKDRFLKVNDLQKDIEIIETIKDKLVTMYAKSSTELTYFSDSKYENSVKMDVSNFKKLFNFFNVIANRNLDDRTGDKSRVLSKNMIELASVSPTWESMIGNLPDKILQPIQNAGIQLEVKKTSLDSLSSTMKSIAKTNGGKTGEIVLDMDVTEEAINSLLKNITNAKYQIDNCYLKESSQGLGYSNLIYMHIQLEKYKKLIDPFIVNIFIIEEPEAHMHPQMQNAFMHYILDLYSKTKEIQGFISTHSSEVIRVSKMKQIRVLRKINSFESRLYDLHSFSEKISANTELEAFYDWFYTINFSDIVFADKIIMYEGDTERMLIKTLLKKEEYEELRLQYLSYIQVGGAYAYNYRPIIHFLEIKTLLITDLDYEKDADDEATILDSTITNSAIKYFYADSIGDTTDPKVSDLYKWKTDEKNICDNGNIYIAFQGPKDKYARTLEEAMLGKHYSINAFDKKDKKDWKQLRKNDKLKYTIPRNGEDFCLRDIVLHSSNKKTDFMYSVILNSLVMEMTPEYIEEALIWLKK